MAPVSDPSDMSAAPGGAVSRLRLGDVVDRYLLLEELSTGARKAGGMRTFLSLDRQSMEEVVLRVVEAPAEQRARFLKECGVARQIDSPYLPRILSAGTEEEMLWIANMWRPSVTLKHLLAGGALPLEQACRILWAVCEALQHLHGRGLVHGDLCPRNVLFTRKGEVFLSGFLPAPLGSYQHGFPDSEKVRRYTPPEWAEQRALLPTGDVYALGLLSLEILTGRPVFPKATLDHSLTLQQQLYEALEKDAATALRRIPAALHKPVRRMLDFDRSLRPVTVMNLLPMMETALAGTSYQEPVAAVIQEQLRYPLKENGTQLLDSAEALSRSGKPLPAAARLRLFAAMRPEPGARELQHAKNLMVDCLWSTFRAAQEPARERLAREALCLQIYRAADMVKSSSLSILARLRLRAFTSLEGPLARLLPASLTPQMLEGKRKALASQLRVNPASEDGLLGLAVLEDLEPVAEGQPLALLKAELCARYGEYRAALTQASRGLLDPETSPRTLEAMADLLESARRSTRAAPRTEAPAPPLDSTPPSESLVDEVSNVHEPFFSSMPASPEEPGPTAPPPGATAETDEAPARLDEVEALLEAEQLEEASVLLGELPGAPGFRRDVHYPRLCTRIREFLWKALLPAPASLRKDLALERVLGVARSIGFSEVVPVAERILVHSIPEEQRAARLETLLETSPDSIPILQAASRTAADGGDDAAWIRHLTAAGATFLEVGEMMLASKMFMALRALDPGSEAATRGLQRVFELGSATVEADQKWRMIEERIKMAEFPSEALIPCRGLLALYPHYVPALEQTAKLHELDGSHAEAAAIFLELARRAMYREEEDDARRFFRRSLRNDFGNEEALMYLATLEPLAYDAPREVWRLRVALFEREGLLEAAIFHARTRLTGEVTDFPTLALLANLSRKAGEDPSPHLLAQGHLSWKGGDPRLARECFEAALEAAQEPNELIEELLLTGGIEEVISRTELMGLRR